MTKRWTNSNYCNIKDEMVESLESKYPLVGMNREDIYNILGNPNGKVCKYDYEEDNKITKFVV